MTLAPPVKLNVCPVTAGGTDTTRTHGPQGTLARTWPTGSMVLWVAVLLLVYLLLDFL